MDNHNHDTMHNHAHATLLDELLCHLPYAIFSVAFSLIMLSLLSYVEGAQTLHQLTHGHSHSHDSIHYRLFHSFHFLHLLFAGTGTMLMFRRYSKNLLTGILVGFFVPAVFCTLSDAILPFIGGRIIGLPIHFHWCFLNHLDTVIPFLGVGILNGLIMSTHKPSRQVFYSTGFHFLHIFISSMASILYLISFGFHDWWTRIAFVFVYIIIAVVVPCTLADIIVPVAFANRKKSKT